MTMLPLDAPKEILSGCHPAPPQSREQIPNVQDLPPPPVGQLLDPASVKTNSEAD